MKFDIAIIGGGFSGLTAGLALAQINPHLSVALLEKNDIVNFDKKRDGRVFAISKSSADLFKEIGILDELKKNSGLITDIRITDGDSPFYLHFGDGEVDSNSIPNSSSSMGIVIENYHIHNALRDAALKQSNLKILSPNFYTDIKFENESALISLNDGSEVSVKLLVAADGRNSPLREKFNIRTFEKSYGQTAIVFNITHEKPHLNIAQEKFLPEGPFAVLPMKDICQSAIESKNSALIYGDPCNAGRDMCRVNYNFESSIVWTVKNEMADLYLNLDEENFIHELQKRLKNYLGVVKISAQPFKYPLNLVNADSYFFARMVLVGDAAHGIHPIAGQGFNTGIDDIKILAKLVKEYFECGLDIGSEMLLQKYNKSRKWGAGKMILATDSLNALFANKIMPVKLARDLGLGMVQKIPKLKKFFIGSAGGH